MEVWLGPYGTFHVFTCSFCFFAGGGGGGGGGANCRDACSQSINTGDPLLNLTDLHTTLQHITKLHNTLQVGGVLQGCV